MSAGRPEQEGQEQEGQEQEGQEQEGQEQEGRNQLVSNADSPRRISRCTIRLNNH
jgi:hypothetical protein